MRFRSNPYRSHRAAITLDLATKSEAFTLQAAKTCFMLSKRIIQACQSSYSTTEQLRLPHSARCLTTSSVCVSCPCSINLLRRQSPGHTRRENTRLCETIHLATAFFCFALAINLLCHSLPHERFAQATHVTRGTAADCLEVTQILQTLDCFQWTNIANPSFGQSFPRMPFFVFFSNLFCSECQVFSVFFLLVTA